MAKAEKPKPNKALEPENIQKNVSVYNLAQRNALLKKVDYAVTQKAWFTLAHLLLNDDTHVIDVGCGPGSMTFAMAALAPHIKFTGIDKNKRLIIKAKEEYQLDNLKFESGDAALKQFPPESVDAIINSFSLHEVYSTNRYNPNIIAHTLESQFKALKKDGLHFIRDFARPPPNEMVYMEIPDKPSKGQSLKGMSEADLLVWYSANARPKQDPGCGGFFLEELPARIPHTRLFHLPYKWAYEFIIRKDERERWESELPMEYTFYTMREFRKQLGSLGARVEYLAPHWDEKFITERFDSKFRLYQEDFTPITTPQTSFLTVARKMAERKSLSIQERRPTPNPDKETSLIIRTMRNEKTGELQEIVSRQQTATEVLPYYVDPQNRLKLYLHEGVPRALTNSIPRKGRNIDMKQWSSHLIEAIAVAHKAFENMSDLNHKESALFARDYLGLKPQSEAKLIIGPAYYPAPDYIDEKIQTFYLPVEKATRKITPKNTYEYAGKFQAKGQIREFDAQQVLDAIAVGMIPNARLELQILSLMKKLEIRAETWTQKNLIDHLTVVTAKTDIRRYAKLLDEPDKRFREIKGRIGQLRNIHSIFVEQGNAQGALTGLSSQDLDFVVTDDQTINTAVVIPLTKSLKGDVFVSAQIKHLPVPQRYQGTGAILSAPSFTIPAHIRSSMEIKRWLAEKFAVSPECVAKLGESYFTHIGVTQQRIHPYAIAAPEKTVYIDSPYSVFVPIKHMRKMWKSIKMDTHFMITLCRAWKYLPSVMKRRFKIESKATVKKDQAFKEPDWIVPDSYDIAPILQQEKSKNAATFNNEISLNEKIDALQQVVDAKVLSKEEEKEIVDKIESFKIDQTPYAPKKNGASLSAEFESEIDELIEKLENHPSLDLDLS